MLILVLVTTSRGIMDDISGLRAAHIGKMQETEHLAFDSTGNGRSGELLLMMKKRELRKRFKVQ